MPIPQPYTQKVEELRKWFEDQTGLSVATDWDFNMIAAMFRFDEGPAVVHLLRISNVVLSDNSAEQIIESMENSHWRTVLESAGPKPVILTSTGISLLNN